ncbi:MAG TPA: sulfatase-like hydrolase/transferase [Acidobacteriota bacterium]|nr:sulfatase-like hydrolase/transferase [Acidobacteriota bacterium]
MHVRKVSIILLALALGILLDFFVLVWPNAWIQEPVLPPILVFLTDDLSVRDVSAYGAPDVRTPQIDRLAKVGMRFDRAFIASPACAPSRAALLTGLMPARNGAEANHSYPSNNVRSLIPSLQELGYEVAAFGKVGHGNEKNLLRYGFDHLDQSYQAETVEKWLANRNSPRPLCLFVGSRDPHVPWKKELAIETEKVVLPPFLLDTADTRTFRSRYYADVVQADADFGAVYDLFSRHFGPDSLVVFSSDHGGQWPFGKWHLYDEGIRVPLVISWPGKIAPGSSTDAMVNWVDLIPTLIELAGGNVPRNLDGWSFQPVLKDPTSTHRDWIFTTHTGDGNRNIYPIRSIRTQRWKYIRNLHPDWLFTTHMTDLRRPDAGAYWNSWEAEAREDPHAAWLVRRFYLRPPEELYDLESDPDELNNLAHDPNFSTIRARLSLELDGWMAGQNDRGWVHEDPRWPAEQQELLKVIDKVLKNQGTIGNE